MSPTHEHKAQPAEAQGHVSTVELTSLSASLATKVCDRCQRLPIFHCEKCHNREQHSITVYLGRLDELKSQDCAVCQFHGAMAEAEPYFWGSPTRPTTFGLHHFGFLRQNDPTNSMHIQNTLVLKDGEDDNDRSGSRLLQYHVYNAPTVGPAISPESHDRTIDPLLIKAWISKCRDSEDHDACNRFLSGNKRIDISLIDVVDNRLIKATTDYRYVALSYVGGANRGFEALRSNRNSLALSGSLSNLATLSTVAQDSMQLCKSIGVRYLWIDTVCITQDDPRKHKDIANMDLIYEHAIVTLVVPLGTGPLYGLPGATSRPRPATDTLKGIAVSFSGPKISVQSDVDTPRAQQNESSFFIHAEVSDEFLDTIAELSPYEKRGWTLQERVLSPRLIYFTNWMALFVCAYRVEKEPASPYDVGKGPSEPDVGLTSIRSSFAIESTNSISPANAFRCYEELMCQYVVRDLSFESDRLNAFAGIAGVLSKCSALRFRFGMPAGELLHLSLLWFNERGCTRSNTEIEWINGLKLKLPSWAWGAWTWKTAYCEVGISSMLIEAEVDPESLDIHSMFTMDVPAPTECQQLLQIHAWVTSLSEFSLGRMTVHSCCYLELQDATGKSCGSISTAYDGQEFLRQVGQVEYELLLVSRWRAKRDHFYGTRGETPWDGNVRNWSSCRWDKKAFNAEFPCFMMFLVIQHAGEYAERVGVGLVHEDAWNAVPRTQKVVKLI